MLKNRVFVYLQRGLVAGMILLMAVSAFSMKTYAAEITYDNFDYVAYADTYADLKEAFGYDKDALYQHYINNGIKEGRTAQTTSGETVSGSTEQTTGNSSTCTLICKRSDFLSKSNFDAARYAADYADLAAAFGTNTNKLYNHYVNNGEKEGRKAYSTNERTNAILTIYDTIPTICNDGMTDEMKARAVHDFLANTCQYDVDNYYAGTIPNRSYHPEGPMLYHVAVCQGYAEAYDYFLGLMGIECTICTGRAYNGQSVGAHAWNRVTLNGNYYYVDVTWDDPVSYIPMVRQIYNLCTYEQISQDHFQSGTYDAFK
ncbi:MAG: hypothetical protein K5682_08635 [Lachnospiraceae bacterium]|nr:hypothetical protein [Lachnospiraceae bacterium]